MFYGGAGSADDKSYIVGLIDKTLLSLCEGGAKNIISGSELDVSRGIIIEGNVNFNAAAFAMDCSSGISRVAQQIIAREYVWDKIRLEGGAYGGGCGFGKHFSYIYSYRDPNFEKTYDVFRRTGEYLAKSNYTQQDIDRFIIGTINDIDKPMKKHSLTRLAMRKHFAKENKEFTIKRREQILSATPYDIKEFGNRLSNCDISSFCTVGQEKAIKNCQIFKELYRID